MSELIPLSELFTVENNLNSVDAKALHKALGSRTKFYDWINSKLDGFKINEDYSRLKNKSSTLQDKVDVNYILTFKVAKHLAMMTKSKKGEEVRNYFLECEDKALNSLPQLQREVIELREQVYSLKHLKPRPTRLHKILLGVQENLFGIFEPIYSDKPVREIECSPNQIADHELRRREKQALSLLKGNVDYIKKMLTFLEGDK